MLIRVGSNTFPERRDEEREVGTKDLSKSSGEPLRGGRVLFDMKSDGQVGVLEVVAGPGG
ncbi:hypothetical protein DOTSEDRAFT_71438 [Dothistroma septosporum NZE10]|uniref:Uncharacterized protein n=1 Tax=Dothistroma septosporum (strain NZE10 / CBS 128990) TaxID=675120 RepID=N1PTQ9_DOTSN|nr:hypothetical protein DOTSEDRAFT_71438 [Dothistroma septosporum NZE10]